MIEYRKFIEQAIAEPDDCLTSTCKINNIYGEKIWRAMNKQSNAFKLLLQPYNINDYYYHRKLTYAEDGYIGVFVRENPEVLIDMAFGC